MKRICLLLLTITLWSEEVPYDRFVSLGHNCITRFQINNHLTKRFIRPQNAFGGGQLFDWMMIHDYDLFIKALNNDLRDLLERPDLVVKPCFNGTNQVTNVKYQMTWNHLFKRDANNDMTVATLDLDYPIRKQKIDYLVNKFKDLKNYRTLYIITYPGDLMGCREPDQNLLERVRVALERFRGNNNFFILYLPLKKKFKGFNNIKVKEASNPYSDDFWHKLLMKFPFTNKIEKDESHLDDSAADMQPNQNRP